MLKISATVVYSALKPGSPEAFKFARQELHGLGDAVTKQLNAAVARYRWVEFAECPREFSLIVVRASDGVRFDLYFMDEDSLFLSSFAGVSQQHVVLRALDLMKAWRSVLRESNNGRPSFFG